MLINDFSPQVLLIESKVFIHDLRPSGIRKSLCTSLLVPAKAETHSTKLEKFSLWSVCKCM